MKQVSRRDLAALVGVGVLASACGTLKPSSEETSPNAGPRRARRRDRHQGRAGRGRGDGPAAEADRADAVLRRTRLQPGDPGARRRSTRSRRIKGVDAVETFAMGSFFVAETEVTYAAVNPATFRRFTPPGHRPDPGGLGAGRRWRDRRRPADRQATGADGRLHPARQRDRRRPDPRRRLRADPRTRPWRAASNAVVNYKWIEPLGMQPDNAMLIAMGSRSPQSILKEVKKYAGPKASVLILGPNFDIGVTQTALPDRWLGGQGGRLVQLHRQPRRHRQP